MNKYYFAVIFVFQLTFPMEEHLLMFAKVIHSMMKELNQINLKLHSIEFLHHLLVVVMIMVFHRHLYNQMLDDNLEHKLIDVVHEGNLGEMKKN